MPLGIPSFVISTGVPKIGKQRRNLNSMPLGIPSFVISTGVPKNREAAEKSK